MPQEDHTFEPRAATTGEVTEGLKAVEEAEATRLFDLATGFAGFEDWRRVAYVSACQRGGSSTRLHIAGRGADVESNGSIRAWGSEAADATRIAATFETPSAGAYACTVRLQRASPTHVALYEFKIDQTLLAMLPINPHPTNYTFAVKLPAGSHTFSVQARGVDFWFFSLTVLHIPVLAPA